MSSAIHNVCSTDDWGNTFCRAVTVENKCINCCFVYRRCQPNCYGQGPLGIPGMETLTAVAVAHVVSHSGSGLPRC